MRLVCPSCQAAYEVPDAVVGDGSRRMRCARCEQEWTAAEAMPARAAVFAAGTPPDQPPTAANPPQGAAGVSQTGANPTEVIQPDALQTDALQTGATTTADAGARPKNPADAPAEPAAQPGAPPPPPRSATLPPMDDLQWPPIAVPGAARHPHGAAARAPSRVGAPMLAWMLTVVAIGVAVGAAYAWRADVMRVWPPSERVYAALGVR